MTNREYYEGNKVSFSETYKAYQKWHARTKDRISVGNGFENWLNLNYREKSNVMLLHTPIFDVIEGKEVARGFKPIKVVAPDWVTAIVEHRGKFLMERQLRFGNDTMIEEFPCGMVESGETAIGAAVRELEEETGLCLKDEMFDDLGGYSPNPAFMTNVMHYFYVRIPDDKNISHARQKLDSHEKLEYFWKDKEKVLEDFEYGTEKKPALLAAALWKMHRGGFLK